MILIVDDKKENLLSLKSLLSVHSYPVDTADSGEEALKKVLKNNYALIILDVQMPGMDGFEVAETISGYSKTEDTPVIFLSAVNTDKKFITKGFHSGAIDYITKPIDPDILLLKVNTLYKLYEQKRQLNEMQISLRSEIEFRKKAQQESTEKAQELKQILESIPQITFTTCLGGLMEYTNNQWLQFAKSKNEFPETHPDDPDLNEVIEQTISQAHPFEMEIRLKLLNSNLYRYHLLSIMPIHEKDKIIKWVGTFTDIDDQKQAIARKDEFISVASHELKTPLTSIKGYVQLLQRTMTGDVNGSKLYIDRTLNQIKKLDTLIADLLDISKIESGKMKMNMKAFNFGQMLNNTAEIIRQTYPDYELIYSAGPEVEVFGDEVRLEQVLINFLSNAIKYSPNSKTIELDAKPIPGKTLMVRVKDNGLGIHKKDQPFIFDKFFRAEESSKNFQGLGIGLYISADILQRHNAVYGVESEPGIGSVFYFSIPFTNISNFNE
jgi:signal transduction histidine kinase/DNA-binding response OmpR family regulator